MGMEGPWKYACPMVGCLASPGWIAWSVGRETAPSGSVLLLPGTHSRVMTCETRPTSPAMVIRSSLGTSTPPAPAPCWAQSSAEPGPTGAFTLRARPCCLWWHKWDFSSQSPTHSQQLPAGLPAAPGGGRGVCRQGLRRAQPGLQGASPPRTPSCCSVNQGPSGTEQSGSPTLPCVSPE